MIFRKALKELLDSGRLVTPAESFQAYLARNGVSLSRTAQYISVDSLSKLDKELCAENVMVFRLGSPPGTRNTYFALAKAKNGLCDYFLIDEEVFTTTPVERFEPNPKTQGLVAFEILSELTETSLVNLAIASDLLPYALGLQDPQQKLIPATVQSTFDFHFRPHRDDRTLLHHQCGQVEIDALFAGRRDGREKLFVVEAKSGKKMDSVAKHKLYYPLLSLMPKLPRNMDIVPVYLRTVRKADCVEFNIAECSFAGRSSEVGALNELKPVSIRRLALYGFM